MSPTDATDVHPPPPREIEPRLTPPEGKGHVSVAKLDSYWYIACQSDDLRGSKPLARAVLGIPMVFFRDEAGRVGALLDRCPHRNVPLSLGRVVDTGCLECCYHGWQFDADGVCRKVPGLVDGHVRKGREVESFPVREIDGFVWVYPRAVEPAEIEREPFALPHVSADAYTTVVREVEVEGSVHAAAENALDVPHTAFLHRGLFRTGSAKNRIRAEVRRWHDRVEAEYIGEPRPPGVVARILSPSGGIVEHWDRFFLPSIAQVEYKLGTENHFVVTSALTPLSDFRTRMFAVISFRTRVPGRVLRPILEPLAMRIFKQDAEILRIQTDTIRQFGGEQYMSTDIDVLGRDIWRLLKHAEAGNLEPADDPVTREVELMV